jgi:small subunit ribosomal protein S16
MLMAVKMRLKKFGRRHRSFYRLGVMDSRTPRDGRVIEELGWYDPACKDTNKQLFLVRERIEHWLKFGAQPTPTVQNLLVSNGIVVPGVAGGPAAPSAPKES